MHFFNSFNALFQSRQVLIHKLFDNLVNNNSANCSKFHYSREFEKYHLIIIHVDNENYIQDLNNIYVGPECESFLVTQSLEVAQEIKLNCLDF